MMNLALPMDLLTASHHHHHSNLNHLNHHHHHSSNNNNNNNHHHPPPTRLYNSPPPISNSDPTVNDCKLIEYRGKKLVSFTVSGEPMLCLPQAVDIFLKNYVGGPHTVYCKLKRLDIVPLVCNTEQIRVLRGLGVLQPGVNRCKLLSCKDFDVLLDDCENASKSLRLSSSRPGRPPKRGPLGLSMPSDYLTSNHSQLKKHRLENNNGDYPFENGHLIEKSTLMSVAENSHSINHMASFMHLNNFPGLISRITNGAGNSNNGGGGDSDHQQQRRLSDDQMIGLKNTTRNEMEAIIRSGLWSNANYQSQYEDMVKHLERMKEEQRNNMEDCNKSINSEQKLLKDFIPSNDDHHHSQLRPILNLSKSNRDTEYDCQSVTSDKSCQNLSTTSVTGTNQMEIECNTSSGGRRTSVDEQFNTNKFKNNDDIDIELTNNNNNNNNMSRPESNSSHVTSPREQSSPQLNISTPMQSPIVVEERTFSMEVLLRNIQALLKIATDNAMQHEKQIIYEKAELKMDVLREKEVKDSVEKKLMEERKLRVLYQKRYRKERKLRTRLG